MLKQHMGALNERNTCKDYYLLKSPNKLQHRVLRPLNLNPRVEYSREQASTSGWEVPSTKSRTRAN